MNEWSSSLLDGFVVLPVVRVTVIIFDGFVPVPAAMLWFKVIKLVAKPKEMKKMKKN